MDSRLTLLVTILRIHGYVSLPLHDGTLSLHHGKQLHIDQKNSTFSLIRSREVKKQIGGKKLEKTSNITVIFTGVVEFNDTAELCVC
jgi:hypothetical protein